MRKLFIPMLMAGVLMPAAAYAERGENGPREHRERSDSSSDNSSNDRPQHVQRIERSNNDAPRVQIDRTEHVQRSADVQGGDQPRVRRFERREDAQPVQQVQPVEHVEHVRRTDRDNDGFVGSITRVGREGAVRDQDGVQVHRDGGGFTGVHDRIVRDGDRDDHHRRWSGDWRHDHRYDWRSYRNRYHSLFRLGRYYDPYGWNYSRFSIGFNLWPSYYGSNYWLNDPWQYRLPPVYGPYRWVRYYDDALLVNIYTGEVVDVIYNVFW
ncbi:RcnB family protein [Sphingomonas sp.]|uniref:RcnB family protein n=1 Tax=Sphingomonas sp. TaxID=28214 RepID=UPI0025DFD7E6|nr:RcnB family protein [Sphingomonas sp.]